MPRLLRVQQGHKAQVVKGQEGEAAMREVGVEGSTLSALVACIQALIPLGLRAVAAALQHEVTQLAGPRYSRTRGRPDVVRRRARRGSVYLLDQKLRVEVPRVRDRRQKAELPLAAYAALQAPRDADTGLFRGILRGLSCGQYAETAEAVPEAFGLSASSVSRRFIRASAQKLQQLHERRLDRYLFVALVLDGKTFAADTLVSALGITATGEKVCLRFVQIGAENAPACGAFLSQLVERGLRSEHGLLCVIDGAKGLRKAVAQVFGPAGVAQRCQWHKRENVVQYLPKGQQGARRRKLQAAYAQPPYAAAKAALARVPKPLQLVNCSAVESPDEGLEETLTLHRLDCAAPLGASLKTTNCLESIHAQVEQCTAKVDHWRTSDQKQRWMAAALLHIEPRLRRIKGHHHLPRLQRALAEEVQRMPQAPAAQAAA